MTERTVAVRLDANVQGYIAAMSRASNATKQFADKSSASITKNKEGINNLSRNAGLLGVGVAVGIGAAVKSYADFDQAVSGVAATGQDARQNLDALRKAAIKAGADTKYSATEAAQGQEALAKANVSAKDSLGGGLTGALNLAAAGNLSVADSADVAATAMNQFKLQGKDVPHIADLLAAGAGKAQGEVSDMALALKQSGLVAAQSGLTLEETVGTLSQFASAGLIGSDAGTSFKTMLQALTPTSKEAQATMDKLGISAYDTRGNFIGMANYADNLKKSLSGMSVEQQNAALKTIYGSDAVRAAAIIFRDGAKGSREWTQGINQQGFAAEAAARKMDNFKGDLEKLSGSLQTALIETGDGANGPLRTATQGVTGLIDSYHELGPTAKSTWLAVGGGIAVVALSAAGVGKLSIAANEAKVALKGLGISAKGAGLATLGIGAAIGVAAYAYGKWATEQAEARQRVEDFKTALEGQTNAINQNTIQVAAKRLADTGALDAAKAYGLSLDTVTQASLGNADAQAIVQTRLDQVKAALDEQIAAGTGAADVTGEASKAYGALSTAVFGTSKEFGQAVAAAKLQEEATKGASDAAAKAAPTYGKSAGELHKMAYESKEAKTALDDLVKSLFATSDAAIGLSDAQIGYEQAVDAAVAAGKKNKHTLDLNTKAGQDNQTALNHLAGQSHKYIEQLVGQGASTKKVEGATKDARAEFIKVAEKMGLSSREAKNLADKYGLIPRDVKTKVTQPGMPKALEDTRSLGRRIGDIPSHKNVAIKFSTNVTDVGGTKFHVNLSSPSAVGRKATGGLISGPGSGTSDSILGVNRSGVPTSWVSDGEFVVNARQTAKNLRALQAINAGLDLPGFAAGGRIVLNTDRVPATARAYPHALEKVADKYSQDAGQSMGKAIAASLEKALGAAAGGGGFGGVGAAGVGRMAQRALAQVGSTAWLVGLCLKFVRTMAGAPGGTYDASAAWSKARFKHPGDRHPPSGVPVYWGGGHGHIAVSVGGGNIVTTDFPRSGRIGLTSLARLTSAWHKPYRGWANDVNGVITSRYGMRTHVNKGAAGGFAGGGRLSGPGTGTSDSIPLWGSNGEYMVNANATSKFLPLLEAINAQGLAAGGPVLRRVQGADVLHMIAALQAPLRDIARAFRDVNLRNAEAAKAGAAALKADRDLRRAQTSRTHLGHRVNDLDEEARHAKAAFDRVSNNDKATTAQKHRAHVAALKAERELKKARDQLDATDKALAVREHRVTKAFDLSNAAKTRAADATQKLVELQRQLADSARQVADQFAGQYRSTSTDVRDWIELMRTGSQDLLGFTRQIAQLRKSGLSEALVQQIIGLGAVAGGDIAAQIFAGGKGLVGQLNAANKGLQSAADALGYIGQSGVRRLAGGGPVVGPGSGTSDSVNIRASNGEWVVPTHAVAANRPYLEAITYGRSVVAHNYARSNYAGGGMVRAPLIDMETVRGALAGMSVYVQNPWTGEYHEARMEGVSMRVMDRETGKVATSF